MVAIRGHVGECVSVEVLRSSGKWGMRKLSGGGSPYMGNCVGVGSSVATAWLKSAEPAELSYFEPS
jgi:hypothetical protein